MTTPCGGRESPRYGRKLRRRIDPERNLAVSVSGRTSEPICVRSIPTPAFPAERRGPGFLFVFFFVLRRAWKLELIERFNLTSRDLIEDFNEPKTPGSPPSRGRARGGAMAIIHPLHAFPGSASGPVRWTPFQVERFVLQGDTGRTLRNCPHAEGAHSRIQRSRACERDGGAIAFQLNLNPK